MDHNHAHQHSQFWPILVRFMDHYPSFWCPRAISMIDKPQCVCTCRLSTFAKLVDSDPFHGLLLTVLGSKAISIVIETQGALTCQSPTHTVLADSSPFRGLLFTVLGSQSDSHDERTLRCIYVPVINTRGFCRF